MITINGIDWSVLFVQPNSSRLQRSNGSSTLGMCDNNNHRIYINQYLTGDMFKKVLCHEITHAAMFSYGINLTIEQEELIADFVATYGEEIISITNYLFKKLAERL